MKAKVLSGILSKWPTRIVSSSESSFALFICILALTFAYRIQLTIGLFTNPVRPFDFNPALHGVWFMLAYLPYDLALVLACFLLSWLLSRVQFFSKNNKTLPILNISGFIFLHILLIILVLVHGIHLRLLFDVQTGFHYSVILEAFSGVSLIEILKVIEIKDYLYLLLPIGLFWLFLLSPFVLRIWMLRISFVCIILLSFISVVAANNKKNNVPDEIRLNPALFLLSDVADRTFYKQTAEDRNKKMNNENRAGIKLNSPVYAHQIKPVKFLPAKNAHPWNIIFFIMESVGTRYIFDTGYGSPMPMPFLHRMAKEGWYLKRHYTTSNVSTKAVFSLFSGLYDFFKRESFGTRSDAGAPAIYNFLDESYDTFLVTPSSILWYFPTDFVRNSGLSEIHSYENLNFEIKEEFHSLGRYIARDEIQTTDFFIERLNKAREPFMGIYISFAAHFPYFDYGPDYHIMEDDGRLINRYYNNLNLLDHMIKRVFDHLQKQGLLERTLFVIVGDHGQAFGQHHPNNFMHYRYSFNENLETPAFFYQPALFKPKTFELPTSHVDILPTLLDAMRIPYDPVDFDGESLFQNKLGRKYIFFYGHEESISSLDTYQIKVQYSLRKNRCWAFDLKLDPEEKNPLNCSSYQLQLDALRNFVNYHDSGLVEYNARIGEKKRFSGTQAPIVIK